LKPLHQASYKTGSIWNNTYKFYSFQQHTLDHK